MILPQNHRQFTYHHTMRKEFIMPRILFLLSALLCIGATGDRALASARGQLAPAPPVEPSSLFTIPTGRVAKSLDLEVSGSGILFGEESASRLGSAVLGLGDIAQMELGTLGIVSSLESPNQLKSVAAGGLKVYLPLWKYGQGIAASFRRSGSFEEKAQGVTYEGKVGEFYTVVSLANFLTSAAAMAPDGGWKGIKIKTHVGIKYVDARLTHDQHRTQQSFWRPVGGLELWRKDSRARIMTELGWNANFRPDNDGQIETIRVLMGGVRFFFSKHITFDVGVRHQSDYGGLSESTLQTKLYMSIPTHALRDRIVGN
jgi:hypothetical protein